MVGWWGDVAVLTWSMAELSVGGKRGGKQVCLTKLHSGHAFFGSFGGYVQDINIEASRLRALPDDWSFEQGARCDVKNNVIAKNENGSPSSQTLSPFL